MNLNLWRTLPLIGRCRWSFINLFSLLNSEYYSFDRKETLKTWVPLPRLCGWRGSPHPRAFVFLHVPGSRLGSAKESIHRISNRNSCETFLWLFMYIHIFLFHNYFGFKKKSMYFCLVGILVFINVFLYHYTFWNNNSMIFKALTLIQLISWQSSINHDKTLMWKTL